MKEIIEQLKRQRRDFIESLERQPPLPPALQAKKDEENYYIAYQFEKAIYVLDEVEEAINSDDPEEELSRFAKLYIWNIELGRRIEKTEQWTASRELSIIISMEKALKAKEAKEKEAESLDR